MPTFDAFLNSLNAEIVTFASEQFKKQKDQAIADGHDFVKSIQADLERWTQLLADGKLTPDDVKFLVFGKKDLAELRALKIAGLAQARLDSFVNRLVGVVLEAVLKAFA